jgi:photosystem II stability/assembly factor-like uncharacterized protein
MTTLFRLYLSTFILLVALLACSPVPTLVSIPPTITPAVIAPATGTATAPVSPIVTATAVGNPQPEAPNPALAQITPTATAASTPPSAISHPPSATSHPPSALGNPLPSIIAEVDLGVSFEQPLQHALALDPEGGRIFVGVPPTLTLVLSADDLSRVKTLPVGGDLALDSARARLYVGAPDGVAVFDPDSLERIGTIPVAAGRFGSTPIVDISIGNIFVVHNGVYTVDPVSLQVTGRISGTFPISPTSAFAVDAAFDAERRLLYTSLNNGIPGSNNGNTLMVYSVRTNEMVYRDNERSIISLQADERSGRAFIARSRINLTSLSVLANEGSGWNTALRINSIAGTVRADTQRGRIYVADAREPSSRLLVLDTLTGALVADVPLPRAYTLSDFNAENDQLYLLSPDGHLLVMKGHGEGAPAPQTPEPSGSLTGSVAWIASSPDYANDKTLFAAWTPSRQVSGGPLGSQAGQLFASLDDGLTWGKVQGGLPSHLFVNALAFSPDYSRDQTLFAALLSPEGRGGGLYVSSDAGRSWRPATQGLNDWAIAEVAVAPGFPFNHTVFALTWQTGLFRSTDGGQTWQRLPYRATAPATMNARTLAISPDYVNDHTLLTSVGDTTSISRDGGENWWTLVENRADSLVLARDGSLMGSFADVGVLRSDDLGATWQAASRGLRLDVTGRLALSLSPEFPRDQTALALSQSFEQSALYRTTDGGASWQVQVPDWTGTAKITALTFSPDGSLFFGLSDGQVRHAKASELKWTSASATLDKLNVEAIAVSPDFANAPPAGAILIGSARTGIFISTDGGRAWQETSFPARDTGTNHVQLALSPDHANDRMIFAAAGGQMFRSNDGGADWQVLSSGLGSFFPASSLAVSPQFTSDHTVLLGGSARAPRVMRSTDDGQTWVVSSGLGPSNGVIALAFVPGNGRVAYAWADQAGLYRSGDAGATWTRVFSPTPRVPLMGTSTTSWGLQSLAISPDLARDRLMFAGFVGAENFRRSADGGATWHPSVNGLPPGLIWGSAITLSPDFTRDKTIYLGTDRGVFCSDDGGVTWVKLPNVGLPQAGVLSLALSPNFVLDHTLFAGLAESGLYVSTDGGETWKAAR